MNNKSLFKLVAIGLLLGGLIMACLYLAASVPTSEVQAQPVQYNAVSDWTEYREPAHTSDIHYVELVAPVNQSRCWLYSHTSRYIDSNKWMIDNCWVLPDGDVIAVESSRERATGDTVLSTDNTPVVVTDNPVQDTPTVVDVPTNDDTPQIESPVVDDTPAQVDNPPADNPTSEDKPEKGDDSGCNHGCNPNNDKPDKGNNGHGNDRDHNDDSNPGNSNDPADNSDDDGLPPGQQDDHSNCGGNGHNH